MQLKITKEEARALLPALKELDTRNMGDNIREMSNINIVYDILYDRLYDHTYDQRSGRTTLLDTDGTLSLNTAIQRLIRKYKVNYPDRNWR